MGEEGSKMHSPLSLCTKGQKKSQEQPRVKEQKDGGYQRLGSRFMVTFSVTKTCHLFLHPSSYHICLKVILLYKIKELPPLQSFMRFELPRHSQICPFSWSYLKSSYLSFILQLVFFSFPITLPLYFYFFPQPLPLHCFNTGVILLCC